MSISQRLALAPILRSTRIQRFTPPLHRPILFNPLQTKRHQTQLHSPQEAPKPQLDTNTLPSTIQSLDSRVNSLQVHIDKQLDTLQKRLDNLAATQLSNKLEARKDNDDLAAAQSLHERETENRKIIAQFIILGVFGLYVYIDTQIIGKYRSKPRVDVGTLDPGLSTQHFR
ncbi:hypothetical protein B0J11DRAFT_619010 [Dendryphion nanum]|uniref:Uncharacterized protein n=1 Tax=Dendryphion nanum TaxID=256645 RepID=A0A9P9IB19_9PLEO|nr:hypothetical protein B0J11DRAFT_619010 [Dendryphion nanum]